MKYTEKQLIDFADYCMSRASENEKGISDGVFQDWNEKQPRRKKKKSKDGKLKHPDEDSKKEKAFQKLAVLNMKFIREYGSPHSTIISEIQKVELLEGVRGVLYDAEIH